MRFSTSLLRLATLLVTFAFAASVVPTTAHAQSGLGKSYSLSGNARFQIGNGLPIPITGQPIPNDRIFPVPSANVLQIKGGPAPIPLIIPPGQLSNAKVKVNAPQFLANNNLFQVATSLKVVFPSAKVTFVAGGRTGPPVVTFCPGSVGTGGGFGCATVNAGIIPGWMRYTATAAQFGGPGQGSLTGYADIAARVAGTPPGVVTAIFARATPHPVVAAGGAFYWMNSTAGAGFPPPNGVGVFNATAGGSLVTTLGQHPTAFGLPNPATSWAGPWTTGMISVTNTTASETFTLSGSDARTVSGIGSISLVSAAISARGLSGPNANRGWLNLQIGAQAVPALSLPGLAAAFGLLALAGGYVLRRRVRS
jgi:hypothetical protein